MTGLNSSSKVIIVADASRFERVKDRKRTSIIGILLDIVFDIAELLGLWQSIKNIGIAY